jgi:hypothetical protein
MTSLSIHIAVLSRLSAELGLTLDAALETQGTGVRQDTCLMVERDGPQSRRTQRRVVASMSSPPSAWR